MEPNSHQRPGIEQSGSGIRLPARGCWSFRPSLSFLFNLINPQQVVCTRQLVHFTSAQVIVSRLRPVAMAWVISIPGYPIMESRSYGCLLNIDRFLTLNILYLTQHWQSAAHQLRSYFSQCRTQLLSLSFWSGVDIASGLCTASAPRICILSFSPFMHPAVDEYESADICRGRTTWLRYMYSSLILSL